MTKPIILVKICYNPLYIIQEVKNIFDEVTSWPQLISSHLPVCNAASNWPHTFFIPRCFLFNISLLFVQKYLENYKNNITTYPIALTMSNYSQSLKRSKSDCHSDYRLFRFLEFRLARIHCIGHHWPILYMK